MAGKSRSAREAAQELGIDVSTFYGWLSQSDAGTFSLQGQPITIDYRQTGANGQGRIKIEAAEVERLNQAMQARPKMVPKRRRPTRRLQFPGITVPLGRPDDD